VSPNFKHSSQPVVTGFTFLICAVCLQRWVIGMLPGTYAKTNFDPDEGSLMDMTRRVPLARGIRRLRRLELPVDTTALARFLIGKVLVHDLAQGRMIGRIVETEAYPVGDAAGHAFRGETPRNRSVFLPHGHAYVYFIYGSCWMMNVSSERRGVGGGVLIRAIEPLEGVELMKHHRGLSRLHDLARGPGRLASAMGIDRRLDGLDLCAPKSPLWLGTTPEPAGPVGVSTRIGLSREGHRELRFYERGSLFVSGPLRLRH
jgi:DNA-3-methyladenine glycosylase